jgi:predicted negative regulator of RcsB-dependent stress response
MNLQNIKHRASETIAFFWVHFLYFLAAAALIGFLTVEAQKYFDRRAVERQTEQIRQYDAQTKETGEQTTRLMELFKGVFILVKK